METVKNLDQPSRFAFQFGSEMLTIKSTDTYQQQECSVWIADIVRTVKQRV